MAERPDLVTFDPGGREVVQVLNRPDIREKFLSASTEIVASSPQGLADTMKSEMARMGRVIKAANIRAE